MTVHPVPINPPEYGVRLWGDAEERAVTAALRARDGFRFSGAPSAAEELEACIARQIGVPECIVTTNGTAALQAALFAGGVRPGDEVLVSALTFHATSNAVLRLGAVPVPIDLDLGTNLAIDHLDRARSSRTSAVVAVHWPGRAFDLGCVVDFCRAHGLALVEDACQAFCAKSSAGYAGTQGTVGVYSFQQNKLLTCGEGGALVTRDPEVARRARMFVDQGIERCGAVPRPGSTVLPGADNLRLTGIHASVLVSQMARLDGLLRDLRRVKSLFAESLNRVAVKEWQPYMKETTGQVFALRFATGDSAVAATGAGAAQGVLLKPIWLRLFHEAYARADRYAADCPQARSVLNCVRVLPLPFGLSDAQRSDLADFCAAVKGECVE